MRKALSRITVATALLLVANACSGGTASTPVDSGTVPGSNVVVGDTAPPQTPPPPPTCPATEPVVADAGGDLFVEFVDGDAGLATVAISQAAFVCSTVAVVVGDSDPNRVAVAGVLAAARGGPLLVGSDQSAGLLAFELERLAPAEILFVGDDVAVTVPPFAAVTTLSGDTSALAAQVNGQLQASTTLPLPSQPGSATIVALANALDSGSGLQPPGTTTTTSTSGSTTSTEPTTTTTTTSPPPPTTDHHPEVSGITIGTGASGVALLVDGNRTEAALAGMVAAAGSGAIASLIDDRDLRAVAEAGRALQSIPAGPGAIHVFGEVTPDARWQLDVIRTAPELPGGGYLVLPRLFVALYGNPLTDALGVLGEQGPQEAVTRIEGISSQYAASEAPVLPAFEIITTVAAAEPGLDGDYSNEMGSDVIGPWIEAAAENDVYVILDLQPGRSDFLSQAKEYEQQLLNPHVGLALDPEWRLGPDQFHLQQIGRVDASEVNRVVEWLAGLVRQNNLPQKVLLLHQFRDFMLENRATIETPPELQVIIQMDGQGAIPDKYKTWSVLTAGYDDHPWRWGWKNFYDEDSPGPIAPAEVLELTPTPVYVSYQ